MRTFQACPIGWIPIAFLFAFWTGLHGQIRKYVYYVAARSTCAQPILEKKLEQAQLRRAILWLCPLRNCFRFSSCNRLRN